MLFSTSQVTFFTTFNPNFISTVLRIKNQNSPPHHPLTTSIKLRIFVTTCTHKKKLKTSAFAKSMSALVRRQFYLYTSPWWVRWKWFLPYKIMWEMLQTKKTLGMIENTIGSDVTLKCLTLCWQLLAVRYVTAFFDYVLRDTHFKLEIIDCLIEVGWK